MRTESGTYLKTVNNIQVIIGLDSGELENLIEPRVRAGCFCVVEYEGHDQNFFTDETRTYPVWNSYSNLTWA